MCTFAAIDSKKILVLIYYNGGLPIYIYICFQPEYDIISYTYYKVPAIYIYMLQIILLSFWFSLQNIYPYF